MKPKPTGWYRGDQKPVHIGPFQRQYAPADPIWYCWWNGQAWGMGCPTPWQAERCKHHISLAQSKPWRGINAESNGVQHPTRTPGYRAGTTEGEKL